MASLTRWTWVWVNSGSWWWTGRPGVLRFTGSQRVGHNWVTELNWTEGKYLRTHDINIICMNVSIAQFSGVKWYLNKVIICFIFCFVLFLLCEEVENSSHPHILPCLRRGNCFFTHIIHLPKLGIDMKILRCLWEKRTVNPMNGIKVKVLWRKEKVLLTF